MQIQVSEQKVQVIRWLVSLPNRKYIQSSAKSPTHLYMSFHLQQLHSRCHRSTWAHHESQHSETGIQGRHSLVHVLDQRKTETHIKNRGGRHAWVCSCACMIKVFIIEVMCHRYWITTDNNI